MKKNDYILSRYRANQSIRVERFKTLDSTNTYTMAQGRQGASEGLVVVAEHQTAGRGRYGRSFYSPPSSGLYMSLLLRPQGTTAVSLRITTAMAVAACEAIEEVFGQKPGIKWVNDLILNERKIAGILTEGALLPDGTGVAYAVVGIGINVIPPRDGFPTELDSIAGTLALRADKKMKEQLAAAILSRFFSYYPLLSEEQLYSSYRERLFVIGKEVMVVHSGQERKATVLDLGKDYRLLLRFTDGKTEWLGSDEIRLLAESGRIS